jgi:hypothetical protein
VRNQCPPDVLIFMVGNKSDLESGREVTRERAIAFQREHGIKYFCEASAKSGDNVKNLFMDAAKFFYQQEYTERSSSMTSRVSGDDRSGLGDDRSDNGDGNKMRVKRSVSRNAPLKGKDLDKGEKDQLQLADTELVFPQVQKKSECKC